MALRKKTHVMTKRLFLVIAGFMLTGCVTTHSVVVMNKTDKDVTFTGTFTYYIEDSPNRVFHLAPGKSGGWFFDRHEWMPEILDGDLKRITLSHPDGCTTVLDRARIDNAVKKRSKWWFYITDDMMGCRKLPTLSVVKH
ncbi:hypothetical protein L4C36_11340 [Photobacterium japonica]|uniref:hypothetical protein n=1 Tax=Photobacterium japonica TaxID=2910235 RepID=UPI003D0B9C95